MFEGVYAALFTPFDEQGEVCEARLREHVEFLIRKGLNGLYLCGNSGQGPFLSVEERMRVTELVQTQNAGRVTLVAHVAAIATRDAKRLAAHANDIGLNAILSLPPIYWPCTNDEVVQYYRDLNEGSELPCFVYHKSGKGARELSMEQMLRLLDIPEIQGLKFTSPDFFWLQDLLRRTGGRWTAFSGPDELFLPALTMGVAGSIGATQNVAPEIFLDIYRHFQAGELTEAQRKQALVTRIVSVYKRFGGIPTAKAFLRCRGVDPGFCRAPLTPALPPRGAADGRSRSRRDLRGSRAGIGAIETEMRMNTHDIDILRELAGQVAEIAALPVQEEKRELWRKLNAKTPARPMVMIEQVCWHEMNIEGDRTLHCEDCECRGYEERLRTKDIWMVGLAQVFSMVGPDMFP